jgi:peroxiredoxin
LLLCTTAQAIAQVTKQNDAPAQQNTVDPLAGLRKAGPGDIDPGTPLMLNPDESPMYLEDMTQIKGNDFMKYMMTNDYVPEPYIDSNKNVKAFVIRKATAEEKERMKQFQSQSQMNLSSPNGMDEMGASNQIGLDAKPFSLTDLKGATYTTEQLKGKIIVMNFWFIECKPCVMEMPELNHLVEQYKDKNVVFLGIATNNETRLKEFLTKNEFKYNIVANGMKTASDYGVKAYPTHIIIDQESKIAYFSVGIGPETMENLKNTINELLMRK